MGREGERKYYTNSLKKIIFKVECKILLSSSHPFILFSFPPPLLWSKDCTVLLLYPDMLSAVFIAY
jgi:hypothetical protein